MDKDLVQSGIHRFTQISFFLNGEAKTLLIAPGLSSLDLLNKELHMYGTKCSCNEGDCGACTVVLARAFEGSIIYEAVNSCLYPAARLHGKHLISIEGLSQDEELHPIQKAILDHHASQCGYCTPGFVMSMFALFASISNPDTQTIMAALEGNLCRCTGYQSILEAAKELSATHTPSDIVPKWCRDVEPLLFAFDAAPESLNRSTDRYYLVDNYYKACSIPELKTLMAAHPDAALIAGGTDIMVQVNISRKQFHGLIDLGDIPELQKICLQRDGLHIGAGVTYTQLMDSGIVRCDYPSLVEISSLIASKQIRNFGTLAGNIANASPVGDSLPLLLVYDAILRLDAANEERLLPLKDFFLSYRKTALKAGEYIREIILPPLPRNAFIRVLKSAKRKSVDIASVSSAIRIERDAACISRAVLAFGGVAATPVVSAVFAESMQRDPLPEALQLAAEVAAEFAPLSDVRGSAEYRKQMIINHVLTYLEEIHG